jgi:hypothetical protein
MKTICSKDANAKKIGSPSEPPPLSSCDASVLAAEADSRHSVAARATRAAAATLVGKVEELMIITGAVARVGRGVGVAWGQAVVLALIWWRWRAGFWD